MPILPNRFSLETIATELNSRIYHLNQQGNPAHHLKAELEAIKAKIPIAGNIDVLIEKALKRIKKQKNLEKQWAAYREERFRLRKLIEAEKAEKSRTNKQETVPFI